MKKIISKKTKLEYYKRGKILKHISFAKVKLLITITLKEFEKNIEREPYTCYIKSDLFTHY